NAMCFLRGFLKKLWNDPETENDHKYLLELFGKMCQTKQIRVVISPKHFKLLNSSTPNNKS
ncbi:MAG: hypothetical protein KAF91_25110, partial [Nostoc sp. TH1S01]|nr:hypothetical protein [Nostoc sp. TH1S01]